MNDSICDWSMFILKAPAIASWSMIRAPPILENVSLSAVVTFFPICSATFLKIFFIAPPICVPIDCDIELTFFDTCFIMLSVFTAFIAPLVMSLEPSFELA